MAQGMSKLNEALAALPEVRALLLSLDAGTSPIAVSGLSGVHRAQLAAAVRHKTQRPLLIVCADENEANRMAGDLNEPSHLDWVESTKDMFEHNGCIVPWQTSLLLTESDRTVVVERDGREGGCERKGCLETYVSATGIKRTAFELMSKMSAPSKLRDIAFGDFDASMISAAAEQGDPIALDAFRFTGEMLGRALADVVTVTSPEAIFLFGGLSKAGKLIFEPTQWYMEENMLFAFKTKVKLLPSGIQGKNAAILGASALIWQEEHK